MDMKFNASGHTFYWDTIPDNVSYTELEYTKADGATATVTVNNDDEETAITEDIKHGLAYFRVRTVYEQGASEWMHIHPPYEITLAGPAISFIKYNGGNALIGNRNNLRLPEKRPNIYEGDVALLDTLDWANLRLYVRPGGWEVHRINVWSGSSYAPATAIPFEVSSTDGEDWKIATTKSALGIYRITLDLNEATLTAIKLSPSVAYVDILSNTYDIVWRGDAPASLLSMQLEYTKTDGEKVQTSVASPYTKTALPSDAKLGYAYFRYRAAWENENGDREYSDWIRYNPDYVLIPVGAAVGGWNINNYTGISVGSSNTNVYDFNLTFNTTGAMRFATGTSWYDPWPHFGSVVNNASLSDASSMYMYLRKEGDSSRPDWSWNVPATGTYHFHIDLNEWTFSAVKQVSE
jgi:hypothetical protein